MRESRFQQECLAEARARGVLALDVHGSGWSNKGLPDLLLFHGGRCAAVELKGDSGYRPQPDQIVWAGRFRSHGVPHHFCRSMDEFKSILRRDLGA